MEATKLVEPIVSIDITNTQQTKTTDTKKKDPVTLKDSLHILEAPKVVASTDKPEPILETSGQPVFPWRKPHIEVTQPISTQ